MAVTRREDGCSPQSDCIIADAGNHVAPILAPMSCEDLSGLEDGEGGITLGKTPKYRGPRLRHSISWTVSPPRHLGHGRQLQLRACRTRKSYFLTPRPLGPPHGIEKAGEDAAASETVPWLEGLHDDVESPFLGRERDGKITQHIRSFGKIRSPRVRKLAQKANID